MNFLVSQNLKPETFLYESAVCFNKLRTGEFSSRYKEINRVGTYETLYGDDDNPTETQEKVQTDQYLKKAIRVIPLLSCITYTVVECEGFSRRVVSVATKRVPADKAMQALFLARYILNGTFIQDLHSLAYVRENVYEDDGVYVRYYSYTPKPWFSEERMLKDNKYFTAVLFLVACFVPGVHYPDRRSSLFSGPGIATSPFTYLCLTKGIADNNFFTSSACSLYSVKRFFHGGHIFLQESLHAQRGYIRDGTMMDLSNRKYTTNAEAVRYRQAPEEIQYREGTPVRSFNIVDATPIRALSMIMSQGETIGNFREGSHYCIENFLGYILHRGEWRTYLPEEKAPLLIQRVIDIINEE